ncbi:hypothetical protein ABVT39_026096 [Epinephelus coioides]
MAYQTLQQEYLQIPVVTRAYTTACVLTTAAVVRQIHMFTVSAGAKLGAAYHSYVNVVTVLLARWFSHSTCEKDTCPNLMIQDVNSLQVTNKTKGKATCDRSLGLILTRELKVERYAKLRLSNVQLEIITPFQLYFNPDLILRNYQVWRLITNFLFFGPVGFNFLFNMIFLYRYCRMLEEGSFRGRTADFVFMFLFGGLLMTIFGTFVSLVFLGQAFTIMLVYVWSRRNPNVRMNFFGLLNFQAPFLPWVLMGFSLLLGNSIIVDLLGIAVGHVYFFLEDVFPNQPGGGRWLKTPSIIKMLFDTPEEDANYNPLPEERPGGFAWGEGQRLGG